MTPEGKRKQKINKLLDSYKPLLYYHMPVPYGYGRTTIDYIGCVCGLFFGIEAKGHASGKKGQPTERQEGVIDDMNVAGGKTFVVNDDESLAMLAAWLEVVTHP